MKGTTPCLMGAGKVSPIGTDAGTSKLSTSSATTAATAVGVDFFGVLIRLRLAVSSPVASATGAPLMPEPPMSMPKARVVVALDIVLLREFDGREATAREHSGAVAAPSLPLAGGRRRGTRPAWTRSHAGARFSPTRPGRRWSGPR